MDRLHGRVAIVTGGGRGIGLATVRKFLAEGAEVALWDLKPEDAVRQLQEEHPGWPVHGVAVDVRSADAVRGAADELAARAGRIDILVNNAGITVGHVPTLQLGEQAWNAILDTNLKGALNCTQAAVPHMIRQRWGRIANVTSVLAEYGHPGHTAYVAAKAGLAGVTRVWAREFGRFGITVNAVRPGYIVTAMNAANPPQLVEQVVANTPLGRLGEPEDVANLFLFLCSEEAGFITGAIVPIDGGLIT
jgi:3-oxoacyl-[acyl-carrier protein] reductase